MGLIAHASNGATDNNTATTSAVDTTGATFLVAVATSYTGVSVATLSDSKSNTWTALTTKTTVNIRSTIYYCAAPTVGSGHTFSFSRTGSFPSLCVAAFDSIALVSPFDVQNGATAAANSISTGSVTPGQSGELLIAGLGIDSGGWISLTINNSFTVVESVNYLSSKHFGSALAYKVQGAAAAINPAWSVGATTPPEAATIATFKPASSGFPAAIIANPIIMGVIGAIQLRRRRER